MTVTQMTLSEYFKEISHRAGKAGYHWLLMVVDRRAVDERIYPTRQSIRESHADQWNLSTWNDVSGAHRYGKTGKRTERMNKKRIGDKRR